LDLSFGMFVGIHLDRRPPPKENRLNSLMYVIAGIVVFSINLAFAEAKLEFSGRCLSNVERALDETNADDSGCTLGAFVESVDAVKGNVFSISYGRTVCKATLNGKADVTLTMASGNMNLSPISACTVKNLKITEESEPAD
jgi:hypothetical protein